VAPTPPGEPAAPPTCVTVVLEPPPPPATANRLVDALGEPRSSADAAPPPDEQ
jgi:hypothetical protein